jgi:hypothetical protein
MSVQRDVGHAQGMKDIRPGRWTAEIDGDFVVFIIGARFDRWHPLRSLVDLGGRRSMAYMLDELCKHPEKGLLGYQLGNRLGTHVVQYWRSFEHLERFAKSPDDVHAEAWRSYWRRVGRSTRTGIWHETFLVRAGEYEAVYGNMPPTGLGKVVDPIRVAESSTARRRLRSAQERP